MVGCLDRSIYDWSHLAVVFKRVDTKSRGLRYPVKLSVFLNGEHLQSTQDVRYLQSSVPFHVGAFYNAQYAFVGTIASIVLFDDALSGTQIAVADENGSEVDAETLNGEKETLAARSAALAEEISSLERSVGAAEQEAARLLASADPAQLANRLEGCRNTMKENARDYLIWRECRRLLDRSIARYEREKQPEVIRRAAELFGNFTRGRYALTGLQKRVAELSRGTLEELMVAMRLALIEYSERESEPLPIVFDDICVNFDLERRNAVLAELERFAKNRQILFLAHPLPGEPEARKLP